MLVFLLHVTRLSVETVFQSHGISSLVSLPPTLSPSPKQVTINQLIRMGEVGVGWGNEKNGLVIALFILVQIIYMPQCLEESSR